MKRRGGPGLKLGAAVGTQGKMKLEGGSTKMKMVWTETRQLDARGATAAEYALLISMIAAVILGAVGVLGNDVLNLYQSSCDQVAAAMNSGAC